MASAVEKFSGGSQEGKSEKTVIYKKVIPKRKEVNTSREVEPKVKRVRSFTSREVDFAISDFKNSTFNLCSQLVKTIANIPDIKLVKEPEIQEIIELLICTLLDTRFDEVSSDYKSVVERRINLIKESSLFNDVLVKLNSYDSTNPSKFKSTKQVVKKSEVFTSSESSSESD